MKKLGKLFSIVLVFVMALSLLTGCSNNNESSQQNSKESPQQSLAASVSPVKAEGSSWKQDMSPITISMFVMAPWYNKRWDTKNNLMDKMITDETGVSVDISSGTIDKLNAMIASNDLPDILVMPAWNTRSQRSLLESNDKVWDLNELIQKYAPNFNPPKSMVNWYKNPNGKWYAMVNYFAAPENMKEGNYNSSHIINYARKDLMNQLGLKPTDFETQDGYVNALKKVKDANLTYNGLKVATWYSGPSDIYGAALDFAEQFGRAFEDKQGNLVDERMNPKLLEAILFLNRLYREGVLPNDQFTLKSDQISNKIKTGSLFSFTRTGNNGSNMQALFAADNKAEFIPLKPIKGSDGAPTHLMSTSSTGWTVSLINKSAKHPERIIRFFDYLYSNEEVQLNIVYGPKDKGWTMVNGHVKKTDEFLAEFAKDANAANLKYGTNPKFDWMLDYLVIQRHEPLPTNSMDQSHLDYQLNVMKSITFNGTAFSDLNPDAGTDEAAIFQKADLYYRDQVVKMILAKSADEAKKLYDDTVNKMNEMGWSKVYKAMNKKFQENKAKLGLKYAWPGNK